MSYCKFGATESLNILTTQTNLRLLLAGNICPQDLSKREATVFQFTTFQMASKYSALRFSYWR